MAFIDCMMHAASKIDARQQGYVQSGQVLHKHSQDMICEGNYIDCERGRQMMHDIDDFLANTDLTNCTDIAEALSELVPYKQAALSLEVTRIDRPVQNTTDEKGLLFNVNYSRTIGDYIFSVKVSVYNI